MNIGCDSFVGHCMMGNLGCFHKFVQIFSCIATLGYLSVANFGDFIYFSRPVVWSYSGHQSYVLIFIWAHDNSCDFLFKEGFLPHFDIV